MFDAYIVLVLSAFTPMYLAEVQWAKDLQENLGDLGSSIVSKSNCLHSCGKRQLSMSVFAFTTVNFLQIVPFSVDHAFYKETLG